MSHADGERDLQLQRNTARGLLSAWKLLAQGKRHVAEAWSSTTLKSQESMNGTKVQRYFSRRQLATVQLELQTPQKRSFGSKLRSSSHSKRMMPARLGRQRELLLPTTLRLTLICACSLSICFTCIVLIGHNCPTFRELFEYQCL